MKQSIALGLPEWSSDLFRIENHSEMVQLLDVYVNSRPRNASL